MADTIKTIQAAGVTTLQGIADELNRLHPDRGRAIEDWRTNLEPPRNIPPLALVFEGAEFGEAADLDIGL
jgi:hypothetical protein